MSIFLFLPLLNNQQNLDYHRLTKSILVDF